MEHTSIDHAKDLTPEQKVVLTVPGYRRSSETPVLGSDGTTTFLEHKPKNMHPSIYIKDPHTTIDEKEFYFWDLRGYLIVRNVLSPAEVDRANSALDQSESQIVTDEDWSWGSRNLAGTPRQTIPDLLSLPTPHSETFRSMLVHPAIVHRLNWMGGKGFRCTEVKAVHSPEGTCGHFLHGGNEPLNPSRKYVFQNGRSYCQGAPSIVVTYQLRDVTARMVALSAYRVATRRLTQRLPVSAAAMTIRWDCYAIQR